MLIYSLINLLFKDPLLFLVALVVITVPLLISVTFHEFSHGYVAYLFGDDTPKRQGRLTLNPLAHIDPLGTIMLFVIGIGWAKPVIINPNNIHGRTKHMLVALAGPVSNILLAIVFTGIMSLLINTPNLSHNVISAFFLYILHFVVRINILLAIFNMIPIPPLDGSRVLSWMLPEKLSLIYERLEPYGMFILILLMFTVGFDSIINLAENVQQHLYVFAHIKGIS